MRSLGPWKAWIRTASVKHLLQEKVAWEVDHYHAQILQELGAVGLTLLPSEDLSDDAARVSQHFACSHCSAVFPARQQCALHEFRKHQELAMERYYAPSTTCGGCLRGFHTTFRVTQHLRYRPNLCWDRLHGACAPSEPVVITLPQHLRGVCRLPAVRRLHGPLRPTSHHRERLRVRRDLDNIIFSNLYNAWLIGLHFPSLQSLISTTIFFSSFSSFPSRSFRRHACSSTALRLISKTVRLHWTWTSTTCLNRRTCPFWTTFTSGICLCADGLCSSNGIDLNKVNLLLRDQPDPQDNH